jgi:hypothetical protein
MMLEVLGGVLKMFFELYNHRNNVWTFQFLSFFKCSFIGLSTLVVGDAIHIFHGNFYFLKK